ncbi:MAG: Trk system potassium transporter TrkA [Planctomycetota bacterium]
MRIVIIGAGAVGFNLARELSQEGHDVAVIEREAEPLKRLQEKLDVLAVAGSGTDPQALNDAGAEKADLLIAVTDSDEVNMVACALAHEAYGVRQRYARVRNPALGGPNALVYKRNFHINRVINPDEITIDTIVKTIKTPGVTDVADFADGQVLLRGFILEEDSPLKNIPLADLKAKYADLPYLVAAIGRGDSILIPTGEDRLLPGDHVFLLMTADTYPKFESYLKRRREKPGRVVISGAERIGIEIARRLEESVGQIVIVDADPNRTELASAALEHALVLRGNITEADVLSDSHAGSADFFVATTERDEINLISSMLARKAGARQTVVLIKEPEFMPIYGELGFDVVINSRLITVEAILRFVRPGKYLSVKKIGEGGAEIFELMVGKDSRGAGLSLREARLPAGALVGAVYRDGKATIACGSTVVEAGDSIIAFVLPQARERVEKMYSSKKRITLRS